MKKRLWPLLFIPWSQFLFAFFFAFRFRREKLYKQSAYIQFIPFVITLLLFFLFSYIPSAYPQWFYSVFMSIRLFLWITIGHLLIYLFSIRLSLYLIDYYEKNINKNSPS